MASPLDNAVSFLRDFGFFDVVLPFLLVFTIVFAVLEKTMILGKEGEKPKKNLDSMVAFAIALFVVAASNIVKILQESLPLITLVLIAILCFMLLMGSFMGTGEFSFKDYKYTKYFLVVFLLVALSLIFSSTIKLNSGESVLDYVISYIKETWLTGPVFSGIVFLGIIILVILFVLDALPGGSSDSGDKSKKSS